MLRRIFRAVLVSSLLIAALAGPCLAAAPGFCAYNSTIQTGWRSGFYNQVFFDTIRDDTSGRYVPGGQPVAAGSTWEPIFPGEEPQWVDLTGQIQINTGLIATGYEVVVGKVVKNRLIDVQTGEIIGSGNGQGSAAVRFQVRDLAQPGDYYWLILYVSNASGVVQIDNHPAHTFWCGIVIK